MKFLTRANVDDAALLTQIAEDPHRQLRHHADKVEEILKQYEQYVAAAGNAAAADAPVPLPLAEALKTLLKGYYANPPDGFEFIEVVRGSATDACPMCGGTNCSTVDHIFPQGTFAEFALFSWNLVPACGCNLKRQDAYLGANPGERVLHPYFDLCLTTRLVRAEFAAPNGDFEYPQISLCVLMAANDPLRPALDFHLREIVGKTFIHRHFMQLWGKMLRGPEVYFTLPAAAIAIADMNAAVTARLNYADTHFGTPNNWDSMFFAGIAASIPAQLFLIQCATFLRAKGKRRDAN